MSDDFVTDLVERLAQNAKPCRMRIVRASNLGKVKLPSDARLVAISEHHFFHIDDSAYKFESSEFEPVYFPQPIPELFPEDDEPVPTALPVSTPDGGSDQ